MRKVRKHQYPAIVEWRIIGCLRCHLLQIVRTDREKRKCPRCNYQFRINFRKIRVWYKSRNLKDVEYMLQVLKLKQKGKYGVAQKERLR